MYVYTPPYFTRFIKAETVLLIYLYPPVLLFPNWVDFFTIVLRNTIRIRCSSQHMKFHGSYREAKEIVPNFAYVFMVQLAK